MICDVCHKDKDCQHTITLNAEQKRALTEATGRPAPEVLHYCAPCWGIVNDRERGASLLRGMLQTRLHGMGRANAKRSGDRLYAFLLDSTKKGPLS
jgi:hypothetical protein